MTFFKTIILFITVFLSTLYSEAQTETPGIEYGDKFIVFEPQITQSNLDQWVIRTPSDPNYHLGTGIEAINKNYLEFTGNNLNGGSPKSPLEFTFICKETGTYRLAARMYQPLADNEAGDKRNDIWIKLAGDFTSNNTYTENELKTFHKFWGRGVRKWGALYNLEADREIPGEFNPDGTPKKQKIQTKVVYNLKANETYTFTIAGRAQGCSIDYFILFQESLGIQANTQDLAAINPEVYRPGNNTTTTPPTPTNEKFHIQNRATGKLIRPQLDSQNGIIAQAPNTWRGDWTQWESINVDGTYFHLKNKKTGKYMRPETTTNNSNLIQVDTAINSELQTQWKKVDATDGYFYLENRWSGKYFRPIGSDDLSADTGNAFGLRLVPTTYNGTFTQWQFINISSKASSSKAVNKNEFNFYPNPAKNSIYISTDSSNYKIEINDLKGSLIKSFSVSKNTDQEISISDLKAGLYVIKYLSDNDSQTLLTKKLIVK